MSLWFEDGKANESKNSNQYHSAAERFPFHKKKVPAARDFFKLYLNVDYY
jgi:hypothetical protein